jgi:hypothetical protein
MRCDFCGEEIEGVPFQKDGMKFCSLECSDAMETGESIPMGEDVLDDPDEYEADDDLEEEETDDDEDEDEDEEDSYSDDYIDEDFLNDDEREY